MFDFGAEKSRLREIQEEAGGFSVRHFSSPQPPQHSIYSSLLGIKVKSPSRTTMRSLLLLVSVGLLISLFQVIQTSSQLLSARTGWASYAVAEIW